ncbi:hypothetical protein GGE60_000820 [Rhizobium leucaenae]|uniref:Uncharacterized protein n=1 Tax=Rhizobium leucaenae TaxID=29450 RepID=A0A7W7EIX7_9HYPH|nr:hypothetical protein [Rhizobium leucaenae]
MDIVERFSNPTLKYYLLPLTTKPPCVPQVALSFAKLSKIKTGEPQAGVAQNLASASITFRRPTKKAAVVVGYTKVFL